MKYLALLRWINVWGKNIMNMKVLENMMTHLWYTNVSTYLNTWNIFFSSSQSEKEISIIIEQKIKEFFWLTITVLIKDMESIEQIIQLLPSDRTNNKDYKTDIIFLRDTISIDQARKDILTHPGIDHLLFSHDAILRHIHKAHYKESKMNDFIKNKIYKYTTIRNCNTVRKIHTILQSMT